MTADLILVGLERNAAGRCRRCAWTRSTRLLRRYGYPQQYDLDAYRIFSVSPVEEYYVRAGFDFSRHPFPVAGRKLYAGLSPPFGRLPAGAGGPEKRWKPSAPPGCAKWSCRPRRPTRWRTRVTQRGIRPYFDELLGLSDIYARSKVAIGLAYLQRSGFAPERCVMIGDSVHDAEVAQALGVRCVLLCRRPPERGCAESRRRAGIPQFAGSGGRYPAAGAGTIKISFRTRAGLTRPPARVYYYEVYVKHPDQIHSPPKRQKTGVYDMSFMEKLFGTFSDKELKRIRRSPRKCWRWNRPCRS